MGLGTALYDPIRGLDQRAGGKAKLLSEALNRHMGKNETPATHAAGGRAMMAR